MLTLRVYLTWFPNINFYQQPFYSLGKMTDPYLRVFRGIVPPLLGFDLSPLLGFSLLTFLIDIFSSIVEYAISCSALCYTEIFAIKVRIILSRTARNDLRIITFEANKSTPGETTFSIIITVRLAMPDVVIVFKKVVKRRGCGL